MRIYIVTEFDLDTLTNRGVCSTRAVAEKIGEKLSTKTNHIDIEVFDLDHMWYIDAIWWYVLLDANGGVVEIHPSTFDQVEGVGVPNVTGEFRVYTHGDTQEKAIQEAQRLQIKYKENRT